MVKGTLQRKLWGSFFSAAILASAILMPSAASAADAKFVESIWNRYSAIEQTEDKLYQETLQYRTTEFEALRKAAVDQQKELERIVAEDQAYLEKLYGDDIRQLEDAHGDDRKYVSDLQKYKHQSDPSYSLGAMWEYYKAADKAYSLSAHWKFDKAISPSYSTSVMWKYGKAVDPSYSTSTMWKYRNTVNPNYSTSLMWKLNNEADKSYSLGTMWRYVQGKISKTAAQKEMDKTFAKAQSDLEQFRADTKRTLDNVRDDSVRQLNEIRDNMIATILEKRSAAIKKLNDIRQSSFGGEITVRPLELKFPPLAVNVAPPSEIQVLPPSGKTAPTGEIQVYIDGELQSFEQPPVNIGGNTLVPMRAIFERLGADIKWNSVSQSVTAMKDGTKMTLTLNSKKAIVGDEEIALSVPAQLVRQTTMVPLRFVSEALGADVKWDAAAMTITIQTQN
ncbi:MULTISPECIES: copper amine oxidase N-terminal domain-containing protein [unclassified Paenibacillus]|uniref:copper amine oxidase N-terminal domain-containing protein n=1 Tax=unclassified Paenibacillus TaxID=185978 RepID=UPI001C11B2A5|nr:MULTISPECIES: copper amine oxidase N-terminal domain-containing protein [unclassified Paenibacillus]MBU5445161.1 copper amine oxidase N-terminal domain-containing protein [Paenibacillus sp. MSJ-34]CAH0122186.1 hypothetical protein PAE9249_04733 [Paenibacillus sp. CECT 9249]